MIINLRHKNNIIHYAVYFPLSVIRFLLKNMFAPLILTLKLDAASFQFFETLRREHFPPERNFLAAHVTLFHHLPGENFQQIKQNLLKVSSETKSFQLKFSGWRSLGKGVAMKIESAELLKLRGNLSAIWRDWLTAQDSQKFQPHITVQNKVAPDEARKLHNNLSEKHRSFTGSGEGMQLWHYLGGPWKLSQEFLFI